MAERPTGFDLGNQKIVVTGAASGIGRAVARLAAERGADVVAADLRGSEAFAAELRAAGLKAMGHDCDVTDRRQVAALAAAVGDTDAVVAAAGVLPAEDWLSEEWDGAFDQCLAVNARGVVNTCRAWLEHMMARRYGRMVLVGSVAGRMGGLTSGPEYVISKGGVHALVRWLSQRAVAHGVCVNGVAPGPVRTPMIAAREFNLGRVPIGRMAEAEEIAWPILFLASPAASYISGAVLDVNGGAHLS